MSWLGVKVRKENTTCLQFIRTEEKNCLHADWMCSVRDGLGRPSGRTQISPNRFPMFRTAGLATEPSTAGKTCDNHFETVWLNMNTIIEDDVGNCVHVLLVELEEDGTWSSSDGP